MTRGQIKCTALICCRVEVSAPALPLDFTSAVHSRTHQEITPHEEHSEAPKAPNNDFQKSTCFPFSSTNCLLCSCLFKPHATSRGNTGAWSLQVSRWYFFEHIMLRCADLPRERAEPPTAAICDLLLSSTLSESYQNPRCAEYIHAYDAH